MNEIILEELNKQSIFLNEGQFSLDYIPDRLIDREEQLRLLASYFRNLILSPDTFKQHVLIQGAVGCGKTVLAKYFGTGLEQTAQSRRVNVKYIHLNCRKIQSEASLLTIILKHLVPYFPLRGFGVDELLRMLANTLEQKNMHLLLALDEIDFIIRRGAKNLLYDLTRFNDDCPSNSQRLSLILITTDYSFQNWIDTRNWSSLTRNLIKLNPFNQRTLVEILTDRVQKAFRPGVISSEIIEQIVEIAKDEGGDARVAIELLWLAGKRTDQVGSVTIQMDYVREVRAKASTSFLIHRDILESLSLHKLILLLAVVRQLKLFSRLELSLFEVKTAYSLVCEQMALEARRNTQVYHYCCELANLGLLRMTIINKDIQGRTSRISVDLPLDLLEDLLIEVMEKRH